MAVSKRTWTTRKGEVKTSWQFCVYDDTGEKERKSGFKTKVQAERAEAEILSQMNKGEYIKENKSITFKYATDSFIKYHMNLYCKGSTKEGYISFINNHLLPYFGKRKLIDITPNLIRSFIKTKIDQGLAPKSINNMISLMGTIMQRMVEENIIAKNVVYSVKKLPLNRREARFMSLEQILNVLDIAKNEYPKFYPFLFIALATGARKNEITAMTFKDIDFKNHRIFINKSLYKKEFTTTKSKYSVRYVNIPPNLCSLLLELKMKSMDKEGLIFKNTRRNPLDPDDMIRKCFHPILEKAGVEKMPFHSCRHSFCSALLTQGLPTDYISRSMGHESSEITQQVYMHISPELQERGKQAIDSIFDERNTTKPLRLKSTY